MTKKLTVPVPAACTAWYLVRIDMPLEQAQKHTMAVVDDYASGSMRRMVQEMVGTPAVTMSVVTGQDRLEMTPGQRDLVGGSRWVSVRVTCPTEIGPKHEWVARTLAGRLAWDLEVPVADMLAECMLSADEVLASLDTKENGIIRKCDWIRIAYGEAGWMLTLTTIGLRRYGLPELRITEVPPALAPPCCALLTGLAFRVHEEFGEAVLAGRSAARRPSASVPPEIRIPDEIGMDSEDVAAAYCLPGSYQSRRFGWRWTQAAGSEQLVGLAFGPGQDNTLQVRPPRDWRGSPADYLESLCTGPMAPTLAAAEPFVREFQGAPGVISARVASAAGPDAQERRDMLKWLDENAISTG